MYPFGRSFAQLKAIRLASATANTTHTHTHIHTYTPSSHRNCGCLAVLSSRVSRPQLQHAITMYTLYAKQPGYAEKKQQRNVTYMTGGLTCQTLAHLQIAADRGLRHVISMPPTVLWQYQACNSVARPLTLTNQRYHAPDKRLVV